MYYDSLVPFLREGDFVSNRYEDIPIAKLYYPVVREEATVGEPNSVESTVTTNREFKAIHIMPVDLYVINERDSICDKIKNGEYGSVLHMKVTTVDYMPVAKRLEVVGSVARMAVSGMYKTSEVITDAIINSASKGVSVDPSLLDTILIPKKKTINLMELLNMQSIDEATMDDFLKARKGNKRKRNRVGEVEGPDAVYKWLDSYFALPEGEGKMVDGREVTPLLVGPTGVAKSASVKELCKKYNYRLVDFRVSFTCRLDYSGLNQIKEIDSELFSFDCPMEELVTCSDGFRAYCKEATTKLQKILDDGYFTKKSGSNGEEVLETQVTLNSEQRKVIEETLAQYIEYSKTPVLFFDEVTRCFSENTRVRLLDGRILTMKELYTEFGTDKPFYVYACDKEGNVKFVPAYSKGITRKNAQVVKVTLDNGAEVICTPDHRWMLRDGSYEQAQHFEEGRSLMGTYFGTFSHGGETYINPRDMKEYATCCEVAKQYGDKLDTLSDLIKSVQSVELLESFKEGKDTDKVYNHKVVKVEWLNEPMDVYDIEVPSLHNFLIDLGDNSGVFVHNCNDAGVEGILVQLLNQKRYGDMTMNGCKFVSATNLNLEYPGDARHNSHMFELNDMYDVNMDLDVAYANRFFPLKIYPLEMKSRWFEWARSEKVKNGKTVTNIHPLILEFLNKHDRMVYDDTPILDAIDEGKSEEEKKSQTFPNYRTWEMVSDYIYAIEREAEADNEDTPLFRDTVINGLISSYAGEPLMEFLGDKGFKKFTEVKGEPDDDVGDFLESTLSAGVPALMVGPSSLGKCVTGDTIVRTDKGLVRIDSLDFAQEGYLDKEYQLDSIDGIVTTSNTYKEFCENVVEIVDNKGMVIKATKNHPLLVLTTEGIKWKRVEDIEVGDTLLSMASKPSFEKAYSDEGYNEGISAIENNRVPNIEGDFNYLYSMLKCYVDRVGTVSTESKRVTISCNIETLKLLQKVLSSLGYSSVLRGDILVLFGEDALTLIKDLVEPLSITDSDRVFNTSTVVSKKDIEPQYVYDVTIPKTHSFIANGFISHNTSRVKAYMKKVTKRTGVSPVLININLASMDTSELMGFPVKRSLKEYVAGNSFEKSGLSAISKELSSLVKDLKKDNMDLGLVDTLTIRAPKGDMKARFKQALDEDREVILFFDECKMHGCTPCVFA